MWYTNRHPFTLWKTQPIAAAGVSKPAPAGHEGGVSSTGVTPDPTAEDVAEEPPKTERAPKADAVAAAVVAAASPRSDASDAPSSVGGSGVNGCEESGVSINVRVRSVLWGLGFPRRCYAEATPRQ